MKTVNFEKLETAFGAAANLQADEREKYVHELASSDPLLANEVSTLLAFDTESNDSLEGFAKSQSRDGRSAAPTPANTNDALPTIAGYGLRRRVGSGGQADVYLARQQSTGQNVAIKVFRGGKAAESLRNRIEAEANALVRLQLPNVVAILDRGQTACGLEYLATRFIAGLPIDLAAAKLLGRDGQQVFDLFAKVAETLGRVHRHGIVHRDLKPSNILVDQDGEPHVLDFGLARVAPDPLEKMQTATPAGAFVGSILWASPEQVDRSFGAIDERSDVYSLGVVMYQALTGRFPYPVEGAIHEVARRIVEVTPSPLVGPNSSSELNLARRVEAILLRALEKKPERRFQSADDFAAALRELRQGMSVLPKPTRSRHSPMRGVAMVCAAVVAIAVAWPVLNGLVAAIPAEQITANTDAAPFVPAVDRATPAERRRSDNSAEGVEVAALAQSFDDELAPFGIIPAGWSQVGPLETSLYRIERSNLSIAGDFVLAIQVSVDRAASAGFELTLVCADGGSDLTVTSQKVATWSDNESWEFRTTAGSVLRGLPVGTHTLTLKRKGELMTLSADSVHQPNGSSNVLASFATGDSRRFQAIRLATNGPAIKLGRLRLHTGATAH